MENATESESRPPVSGSEINCPFYGSHMYHAASKLVEPPFFLVSSHGNQCALIVTAYAPCKLELAGHRVDWRRCDVAHQLRV